MTPHNRRVATSTKKAVVPRKEPGGDSNQKELFLALDQLYQLLEEHSPSWYTQEHHQMAEAAVRSVKKP